MAEPSDSPLLGRETELGSLAISIARDRSVVLVGEAGIGKTALVHAAVQRAGRPTFEGGAFATLDWMPYLALKRALGASLSGDPAVVAAHVERLVGPDVLVVDDLQWADDDTLAALELVLGRIMVIAAIREGDQRAARSLATFRRAGAVTVPVSGLPDDSASDLVRRARPELPDHTIASIVERAAGNPLLLEELAAQGRPSPMLHRALTARLVNLAPGARRVVDLLAVADRPLPSSALGPGVAAACRSGITIERDGTVAIRHVLVADAVRDSLEAATLRSLHGRIASIVTDPAESARHLAAAGRRVSASRMAATALGSTTDPKERAALLVIAADAGAARDRAALRLDAARALDEISDWSGVTRVLGEDPPHETPDERAERAAILAHAAFAVGEVDDARARLTEAADCDVAPGSAGAVRRLIETATFRVNAEGAATEALVLLDDALDTGPAGSLEDVAILREEVLLLVAGRGDDARVRAGMHAAFERGRFRTAADRARVLHYLLLMGVGAEVALDFLLERAAAFDAADVGSVSAAFMSDAVQAAFLAGRFRRAVDIADGLLERPTAVRPRQTAELVRCRALAFLGHLDVAESTLRASRGTVSSDYLGLGETLAALADVALWGGQPRSALEFADAALAISPPIPAGHVLPSLTRAWASWELGLDPGPDRAVMVPRSLAGATAEHGALRAWFDGDFGRAAADFEEARLAWEGFHAPRAWICGWAVGESMRLGGDRDGAASALRLALGHATMAGFEPLAARIRRSLRLAGVRVHQPAGSSSALGGILTARERELVALVERGLTNVEIARRLGLGRPTVARMISSAMSKVGAESRAQLAVAVLTDGSVPRSDPGQT